jgi:hypothetical protein
MINKESLHRQARSLRWFRKTHRITGIFLFVVFIFISITGFLLGWKKNSNDTILPKTCIGTTNNLADWLPIEDLHNKAIATLRDSISPELSADLSRIDIRNSKGVAKFVFENHYWSIQLDGATGKVLQIGRRRSDFIEQVHDGSIIDNLLGTSHGGFKLFYTSISGLALFLFSISGFWLWLGPKRMHRQARRLKSQA